MNDSDTTKPRKRILLWSGLLALVAGIATAGAIAHSMPGHCGPFSAMHGDFSPEQASKHIRKMVDWVLDDVDATTEQKAKVNGIFQAALKDLLPEHKQFHDAHQQVMQLMSQPTIDRTALEQLRSSQMALLDTASKRLMQAVADAAEVLTPGQRQKLMAMHHGHHIDDSGSGN